MSTRVLHRRESRGRDPGIPPASDRRVGGGTRGPRRSVSEYHASPAHLFSAPYIQRVARQSGESTRGRAASREVGGSVVGTREVEVEQFRVRIVISGGEERGGAVHEHLVELLNFHWCRVSEEPHRGDLLVAASRSHRQVGVAVLIRPPFEPRSFGSGDGSGRTWSRLDGRGATRCFAVRVGTFTPTSRRVAQ